MSRIGRPNIEKPKNNFIKVRVSDDVKKDMDQYCNRRGEKKAMVIRRQMGSVIILENAMKYISLESYDNFYKQYDKERIDKIAQYDTEEIKKEINKVKDKWEELLDIERKVRDQILEDQGLNYKELFEKNISVEMPVDLQLYKLKDKYYKLILDLYDLRDKKIGY